MGQKRRKSVKHPKPPPAPSSSGGAEDSSPKEEAPKTLTRTTKSRPAKPQPSKTKTPIPTPTQNNDSGSSDSDSDSDSESESESESDSVSVSVSVSDSDSESESESESESNADEKEVGQQAAPTPVGATTKSVREKMGSSSEAAGTPVGKKLFQRILSDGGDIGDFVMNNGLKLLGADKRAEMEDEWKKLKLEELNLYIRKLELLKKRSVLIAAALQD